MENSFQLKFSHQGRRDGVDTTTINYDLIFLSLILARA